MSAKSTKIFNMIVGVKQGKLIGTLQKSHLTGNEYCCFLGIPYAQPPINELRFQPPLPLQKWSDDILDATKDAPQCIQFDFMTRKVIGSEDCLYLNIYTPQPPSSITNPKAVMVFIHGGGFCRGTASPQYYPGDYLVHYDVILVTIAYRLHALGFLNMGTSNNSGNCGLKDQLLALKWIRENIHNFGGDNKNITLFGESAGASSVHLHMLSPSSKGTFDKAILQSGTALCPWSFTENPEKNGFILGQKLGYLKEDSEELVDFLKTQSAEDICKAIEAIHEERKSEIPGRTDFICFVPSVEKNIESAFLPDHPSVLRDKSVPIPLIVGLNNKEGRLAFADITEESLNSLSHNICSVLAHETKLKSVELPHISERVKQFYFGDKIIGKDSKEEIVNMYTNLFFRNFYEAFNCVISSTLPVYVYEFVFYGRFNWYSKAFMRDSSISSGAAHADELPYLFFREKYIEGDFSGPELSVIKNMCTLWSNFAKTGNPTSAGIDVEWLQSTSEKPYYLQIDENLKLHEGKVLAAYDAFWDNLIKS